MTYVNKFVIFLYFVHPVGQILFTQLANPFRAAPEIVRLPAVVHKVYVLPV